jgi:hypothetical protein
LTFRESRPDPKGLLASNKSSNPFGTATCQPHAEENDRLLIFDAQGTLLIEYPWPEPGTKYVGSGNPRGPRGPRKNRGVSEMS